MNFVMIERTLSEIKMDFVITERILSWIKKKFCHR